ncbi:MAG TPA: hypothetical protein VI072_30740 [Polyangiaceae bacterium]
MGIGGNVNIAQQCPGERVLEQHGSGTLRLVDVTLRDGSLTGTSGQDALQGGGLRANGDVDLERVTLSANVVRAGSTSAKAPAGDAIGGGVTAGGSATARDVTALENAATAAGSNTLLDTGGAARPGAARGGAIAATTVTLTNGAFTSNSVESGSGLFTCATRTLLGWVGCAGAAPGAATGSGVHHARRAQ